MRTMIFPSLCIFAWTVICLSTGLSEERTWTSSSGSTMKGEIVGVKDGKVLIRPVAPPRAIPISSLSKKDQEFIERWQKDETERVAAAKAFELERHMNTPLLKALKGNLQVLGDGDKLVNYDIPTPGKLELIAVYYTADNYDGKKVNNSALKDMSKIYSRLRRRFPHFEMLLYPLDQRETDLIEFMDKEKITFPTLSHAQTGTAAGQAVRATFAGTFPNLMLMDREGKVLVNSADKNPPDFTATLDEIQKVVKDRAPKDEEE